MTEFVSIQAFSLSPIVHPDLFVHSVPGNHNVIVSAKSADPSFAAQSTWKVVPALVDQTNKGLISIESVARPGTYLRHHYGVLYRLPSDDTDLFLNDTSFFLRQGLSGPNGFSFETVIPALAGNFITLKGNQLKLEKPSAPEAATFSVGPPLFPMVHGVGFFTDPNHPEYGVYKTFEHTGSTGLIAHSEDIHSKEAAFAWFLPQRAQDSKINLLCYDPPKVASGKSSVDKLNPWPSATVFQWD